MKIIINYNRPTSQSIIPPKPDVRAERQEQILDAAGKTFARLVLNHASMDDIVAEAGLSKGALYWYYESKDAIILALIERFFARD